jgi:two-component system nitrogen regulation sensor histidine kinase NtrY
MSISVDNFERPGMWGFFICIALVGILSLVRLYWIHRTSDTWSDVLIERNKNIESVCRGEFSARANDLLAIAGSIADDSTLFRDLFQNDPESVQAAFENLEGKKLTDDLSLDITDPRGAILCWSGKSVVSEYDSILQGSTSDTIVVLTQSGLYTYLTVGTVAAHKRAFVFASRPLVVNYPISNRFVNQASFISDLSALVRTDVELLARSTVPAEEQKGFRTVLLTNFAGTSIGAILFEEPHLDAVLQEINLTFDRIFALLVGIGTLAFIGVILVRAGRIHRPWVRAGLSVLALWAVRYVWLAFEFPARVTSGDLFNPSVYSSPFGYGAANSVGETCITVGLFVWTLIICFGPVCRWCFDKQGAVSLLVRAKPVGRSVSLIVLTIGLLWLIRAYGAAIRSFVVDSTIQYYDPLTTVPSFVVIVMQMTILLLTVGFAVLVLLISSFMARIARTSSAEGWDWKYFIPAVLLIVSFVLFQALNAQPIVPWYYSLGILLLGFEVAEWLFGKDYAELKTRLLSLRGLTVLVVASSITLIAVTDDQIHKKEREQAQAYAQQLLKPLDSWISFVLTDGLRSIVNAVHEQGALARLQQNGDGNLAFSYWAKTLLSREGYNSAVVVYDASPSPKELSRFSVGLTAYEQREVLTKVFENEEESVVALDRPATFGASKSYGLWSTIRSEEGKLLGSIALLLSVSERSVFSGEDNEPLRSARNTALQNVYRPTAVSVFENGLLTATTREEIASENVVPPQIAKEFSESSINFIWTDEVIEGKSYESLFARDPDVRGKIVEVGLESTDYRWHIFNFLKLLSAALLTLAGVALYFSVVAMKQQGRLRMTFKSKLLVSFLILGFLPLILLGYYNRKFAAEGLDQEIRKTLARELDLVSQRILGAVSDEEDYSRGINNDFAESIAADLGIDFTVYRRSEVQANSRPELYQVSILDARLPGNVFAQVILLGKQFVTRDETIGSVRYAVGYKPLRMQNSLVGVLAVPAPYRQRDIEEELARRNAYYVAVYAIIIAIIMASGWGIAQQLSTPVRELTVAAREVGKGNLEVQVPQRSSDEIGELVKSFDQMVREIKSSRVNLAQAERKLAWTEMAKQVAHEIKNPLTPMKLAVQHLRQAFKDKAKDLPAIVDLTTKTVIEQIDALSRIATEFSNFARMPERKFERVDLGKTILESVDLFSKINGIEFRLNFGDTRSHIIADRDELRRVFINIFRNSIQAMPKGGVVKIEMRSAGNSCTLSISDSGEGIPPELLSKVFEPNFSTKSDGTGLGLAISQKIIQELNGTISISSTVGKGTTVEITLPV